MKHALTDRFDCPKCRYEGEVPCPTHAVPPTLDIPVWDNQIQYTLDLFVEPQTSNTVLSLSEESAKEELAQVSPKLIGRQMGMAKVEKIIGSTTKQRVLVINREQALQLIATLETFVKT